MLSACQSPPAQPPAAVDDILYFSEIRSGTAVVLVQPVVVAAERQSADLPRRKPDAHGNRTRCRLDLTAAHRGPVLVKPDRFAITRVAGGLTPMLVATPGRVMAASFGRPPRGPGGGYFRSYVELFTRSDRQPGVYRIACSYTTDAVSVAPLTIAELRDALDGVAEIQLAW